MPEIVSQEGMGARGIGRGGGVLGGRVGVACDGRAERLREAPGPACRWLGMRRSREGAGRGSGGAQALPCYKPGLARARARISETGVVTMDGQQAARRPRRVEGLQAVPGCGGVAGAAWAQPPMFFSVSHF